MKPTAALAAVIAIALAVIIIPTIPWVFKSAMEAKAYNRVTGSNVTTWEAMWIELRVNGSQP